MKRSILHVQCAVPPKGVSRDSDPLDVALSMHESNHRVRGVLKAGCLCDACGREMPRGSEAIAESIVPMGQTYYRWEPITDSNLSGEG